jgi:hypothetical protein
MKCLLCREEMDPVNVAFGTHPGCDMKLMPVDEQEDPFTSMLKQQLIDMVKWADKQNPRSHQQMIGPSEIGTLCDRRIGYRLAGLPGCNTEFDPWPSIMGTAIHSWLDDAVNTWMEQVGAEKDWLTETRLVISDTVQGRADLYSIEHRAVTDWKTAGPDIMKKVRRDGPPLGYQIQTHVYGLGFEQLGLTVEKVCLAFLPRAGWLRDMYVWCAPYDRDIAVGAVTRLRLIAQQILNLDILIHGNGHRWEQIDAVPSNDCGWCPFYAPHRSSEQGADETGCPGR